MAFEDIFAISYGKPLLDFLDTQTVEALVVGSNKEIHAAIKNHGKRYPFAPSVVVIDKYGRTVLHWKERTYYVPQECKLTWSPHKNWRTGAREWTIHSSPKVYYDVSDEYQYDDGEELLLCIENKIDIKTIFKSYSLEKKRYARFEKYTEGYRKKKEAEAHWRKTHVFAIKGSTAPTNPWKVVRKP